MAVLRPAVVAGCRLRRRATWWSPTSTVAFGRAPGKSVQGSWLMLGPAGLAACSH